MIYALSWAFYDRHSELLSKPAVLNPTFDGSRDVGGADADLIVDGCLIDIKTTINPRLSAKWLYQLLGYTLLDYSDRYLIREVAIYFARQQQLIKWPLDALVSNLAGGSIPLNHLREHFHLVAQGKEARPLRTFAKKVETIEEIDVFDPEEWIESAHQAGELVGISPILHSRTGPRMQYPHDGEE